MNAPNSSLGCWLILRARCALQGLNSRLVPVTASSTLPALAMLYFGTVPAGGGFIATPVTPSGKAPSALASSALPPSTPSI